MANSRGGAEAPVPSDQYVQSLARGLAVIEAFGAERPELTLSEVAAATGLTRAAARRFLLTLVGLGYARQRDALFSLTPRVLRLGTSYLSALGIPQIAQPHLEALSASVGESTNAAVLDGTEVVYVARVTKRRILDVAITVGTRLPAFATSLGRVLLAGLPEAALEAHLATADLTSPTGVSHDPADLRILLEQVREQGFAATDQELAAGLRSVAAPIHDGDGAVVAAINISSTTAHDPAREFLVELRRTAEAISADLAESPTPGPSA